MVRVVNRRSEYPVDRVTDVLLHKSTMRIYDLLRCRRVGVHQRDEVASTQLFRQRAETDEVGVRESDDASLAAKTWKLARGQHPLDEGRRKIEGEAVTQQALVPVRNHEPVCNCCNER